MGSCPNSGLVPGAVQQPATLLDKSVDASHDIALRPCYGNFEHSEPNPSTLYTAHLDSHRANRATSDPIFLRTDEKTTSSRTGIKRLVPHLLRIPWRPTGLRVDGPMHRPRSVQSLLSRQPNVAVHESARMMSGPKPNQRRSIGLGMDDSCSTRRRCRIDRASHGAKPLRRLLHHLPSSLIPPSPARSWARLAIRFSLVKLPPPRGQTAEPAEIYG